QISDLDSDLSALIERRYKKIARILLKSCPSSCFPGFLMQFSFWIVDGTSNRISFFDSQMYENSSQNSIHTTVYPRSAPNAVLCHRHRSDRREVQKRYDQRSRS